MCNSHPQLKAVIRAGGTDKLANLRIITEQTPLVDLGGGVAGNLATGRQEQKYTSKSISGTEKFVFIESLLRLVRDIWPPIMRDINYIHHFQMSRKASSKRSI
jgi:hypothetical protein